MHPLIARLVGKPAVKNWREHLRAADEAVIKLRSFAAKANEHAGLIDAARAAFEKSPTVAAFDRWVLLEAQRAAAVSAYLQIEQLISVARDRALKDGGMQKFEAAAEEADRELLKRADEIRAQDAKRSEELGEEVTSPAALAAIDQMRETVNEAKRWRRTDFLSAVATLEGVLGGES